MWINGQQQPLNLQLQSAMFYPNTYLNFNGNGEYTKHYYNGMERIASRLGDNSVFIGFDCNDILESHRVQLEEKFREELQDLIFETVPIDLPPVIDVNALQPTGTPNDIYYYHPNHLGSTSFVTDQNQTITQGFLYAPFGEITTEYNINFGNNTIPKYAFNAKELDEETGMYYYEARYYNPPVFTSRDPHFERYFWTTPYGYCNNNPLKYVDPTGMDEYEFDKNGKLLNTIENKNVDILRVVKTDRKENIKYDRDGNKKVIASSRNFEAGTITGWSQDKNATQIDTKDNSSRVEIFEFLAENTNVEWETINGLFSDGKEFNVIGTNRSNGSTGYLFPYVEAVFREGGIVYEHTHSHPSGSLPFPSGYSYAPWITPSYGDGDHGIAKRYQGKVQTLKVYDVDSRSYIKYWAGDKPGYKNIGR